MRKFNTSVLPLWEDGSSRLILMPPGIPVPACLHGLSSIFFTFLYDFRPMIPLLSLWRQGRHFFCYKNGLREGSFDCQTSSLFNLR